jgi:hypothetical protein
MDENKVDNKYKGVKTSHIHLNLQLLITQDSESSNNPLTSCNP